MARFSPFLSIFSPYVLSERFSFISLPLWCFIFSHPHLTHLSFTLFFLFHSSNCYLTSFHYLHPFLFLSALLLSLSLTLFVNFFLSVSHQSAVAFLNFTSVTHLIAIPLFIHFISHVFPFHLYPFFPS